MKNRRNVKVSLVMIVKNEAGGLRRAVESARRVVDEVVIGVDKASYDDTLKIAKELADVCYEFEWEDSFCKARNTYLGKAHGEWILILDGHEYVKSSSSIDWDKTAKKADCIRVKVLMEDGTAIQADRIIKNGTKWRADVHNYPDVKKIVRDDSFLIIHDRFTQEEKALKIRHKQRDKMILKNLGGKDDPRSLYYTGRQHLDMKRYGKAIDVWNEYLETVKDIAVTSGRINERRKVIFDMAKAYHLNKETKKALKILKEDLKEYAFLKGQICANTGDHAEAIKQFMIAYVKEPTTDFTPVDDLDFQLWDFLSVSLFEMKQYEMAYAATQKALEIRDDENIKNNARAIYAHFKAGKEKGAEYYDGLFKNGYDTSRYNDIYEVVLRMIEEVENPNVLELGCGVGSLGKMIIDKGYKYRGFDFSKEAIRHARKLGKDFYIGDVYDDKEYKGDYNVVVATELLEHVDDLKVLSKIKSGVKLIVSVPTFGDVAHLRTYVDQKKDIVDRMSKYVVVNNILFSQDLGIHVFEGIVK